jgi:DNA polymerase-3 subunit epsilon
MAQNSLAPLFAQYDSLVIFDVETSGLDPEKDQVIELAAIRLTGDGATDELDLLVKLPAGRRLPEKIVKLTNITDAMLEADGVPESQAAAAFARLIAPTSNSTRILMVAHNAQFDLLFTMELLRRHRVGTWANLDALDTLTVFKDRASYPHKLEDAIAHYRIDVVNSHRAIDDVRALELVLRACCRKRRPRRLRQPVRLQPQVRDQRPRAQRDHLPGAAVQRPETAAGGAAMIQTGPDFKERVEDVLGRVVAPEAFKVAADYSQRKLALYKERNPDFEHYDEDYLVLLTADTVRENEFSAYTMARTMQIMAARKERS